jgi:hypothetical protein
MLNDPITKYEEQRKFNMAVIRYYMVTPKYWLIGTIQIKLHSIFEHLIKY